MADGGNIILIDDDKDLRLATIQTLELAGFFRLGLQQRAHRAWRVCPWISTAPSSPISRMPDIDGLELFARLSRMDADLPVILVTGHGDIPMAVQAIQAGAYDFIAKPVCCRQAGAKRPARRGKAPAGHGKPDAAAVSADRQRQPAADWPDTGQWRV